MVDKIRRCISRLGFWLMDTFMTDEDRKRMEDSIKEMLEEGE
jgi:hypothetical protein